MSEFNYPLLLKPVAVPRPWGGGRLCNLYDRECIKSNQPIGESWDVSTWPTDPGNPELATVTVIQNGPLAGMPLDKLIDIPVVIKLLDSAEKLSVQVHPVSDNTHKDEMWYVLHADPDAYLFCGFAEGVTPEYFCQLVQAENADEEAVLKCLHTETKLIPGQYFNVPSGTIHAVGPGLVAFEVSECMQVTYRLYDYNRGRALHIDDGCKALKANRNVGPLLNPGVEIEGKVDIDLITQFPTFTVTKVSGGCFRVTNCEHKHLITATMSDCKISGPTDDWNLVLKQSYTCVVPAGSIGYNIDPGDGREVLITSLCC